MTDLSKQDMFTQILLMTLQSRTDRIDVHGLSELIEKKQANPFVTDDGGNSVLHWCAWRKLSSLTEWFLQHYAGELSKFSLFNALSQTPLHWAAKSGDIESLKMYIRAFTGNDDAANSVTLPSYLSKDSDGYNCLHDAAQFNRAAVLEYFLFECGSQQLSHDILHEMDAKGRSVLHWAVFKEHVIMIEW
eukprot:CAMPEP_0202690372 /NCGR_PEP_ID=MMETSP1385-20130828/5371_1 /ASSEMBLY_ACC=CAM_ASM_000861 /TAXON_ID=933848 /ORGANISM="Elphidium margaritaceum" /LENGTH=188 /DNA_ID=CAMNT_0049345631 /DNA_START=43 /DNA_END=606 /DNA_ORIENTATION=-